MTRQPFLHDLTVCLAAPVQAWSLRDGTMDATGACGVYVGDRRVLARVDLSVSDAAGSVDLAHLSTDQRGGPAASYVAMVRVATQGADPLVSLTRTRTADPAGVTEEWTVASALDELIDLELMGVFEPDATPLRHQGGRPTRGTQPRGRVVAVRALGDGVPERTGRRPRLLG